ncbi:MAG: hypothetical protein ACK42Z_01445 [Candidatus Kapaibacteriota bacterium]
MIRLLKKVLGVILSVTIVASSAGVTVLNHFCQEEQRVYVGVEGVYHNVCLHHNEVPSCCESQSSTHKTNQATKSNEIKLKAYDDCCLDQRIIQKVLIFASERNWQKILESFQGYLTIEYIKETISVYFGSKLELLETRVINPIKKIVRYIRILTRSINSDDKSAL